MYKNFFGLSCLPFEDRIQLEFFFTNPELEEVLASMECELRYRQGLGFVVGESGTGKTLLVRSLLAKLDPQDPAVVVKCPADGQMDITRETCKGFGVTLPSQYNAKRGLARLRRRLQGIYQQDKRPMLIVDQAENLSIEAMSTLESLVDLGRDENRLLTMLLVGQPRTIDVLGQPRFDRLRQLLSSELRLHKFTSAQTQDYITHRLRVAGAGDKVIFDPAAMAVIHIVTHGIPRLINRLADASMVAAYSAEQSCVTAELVREMSAQQSQKSQPNLSKMNAVQEDTQMSNLVSRVDSSIQAMQDDDLNIADSSHLSGDTMETSKRARSQITKLKHTLLQSQQSTAELESRAKSIMGEIQDQLREFENETMRVVGVADEVRPQLQRIEDTCDRAVKVEAQLSVFAETLVERADSVQQRISLLITAMTDADACRENIHATVNQASNIIEQSQQTTQTAQESLDQLHKDLKESQHASREVTELVRRQISHVNEEAQRQHRLVVEKERNLLTKSLGEVVNESMAGFKSTLSQVTQNALEVQRETMKKMTNEFVVTMREEWDKMRVSATRDIEKITRAKEETFQHSVDATTKNLACAIENTAEHSRQEMSKLEDKATSVLQNTQKQLEQLQHNANDVSTALASTIENAAVQTSGEVNKLEDKTTGVLLAAQKQLEQITENHNRAWETLQKQHAIQENKHKALLKQGSDLDTEFDDLAMRAKSTQMIVQDAQNTATDLQRDSQDIITRLTSAVDSGQAMTTDVNNACGRVESSQRSISNSMLEIGGACERLNVLSEKATHIEQVSTKIEHMLNAQKGQCESLQRLVSKADKTVELLQPAIASADEKAGRLQSHHAAASSLLKQLTQANVDGQSVVQQVEKASTNAQQQVEKASTNARQQVEKASTTALQQVEKASTTAQQLSEKTSSKIDRMVKDVWDLTAKAETATKELSDTYEDAQKVNLQPTVAKQTTTTETSKNSQEVATQTGQQDVELRTEAYEKLTQQVNAIATVLSKAQDVAKSTREELVVAKETYENLTTISSTANQQITSLNTLIKSASGVMETHEQLHLETKSSTQELQQHLAAMADTTDAGMQMINEFTKQTIDIERQLRTATRKSAQLQANIAEALAQPGEIVAGAKEQAAQLEQVCTAVRKVFSALSQTSLEAQEKIKLFNQSKTQAQTEFDKLKQSTGQAAEGIRSLGQSNIKQIKTLAAQASEGIQSITKSGLGNLQTAAKQTVEQVRSETSRASETLSEWVQETKRAQQRLEHTLQYVPSISQTHPMNNSSPVIQPMSIPVGYDAETAPVNGHKPITEKQAPAESVTMQGDDQGTRKAKIKKLLEEAKRASEMARS